MSQPKKPVAPQPEPEADESVPQALARLATDRDLTLRKYAGAVHIGADLTLYQRRAFNVLLFSAMPHMPETTRHEIALEDLAWGMGLDRVSQRLQRLVESLDRMMEARVVWNVLDENGDIEEWASLTLLPYVKVSRKTGMVTYEFTRAFQERVYSPTEFAEIALRMQRVFRSEHALALYENTRRFLPEGETPWIPLDTFRTLMGVTGKPYYDEYKYLSARLIKPAMQQVNEVSDIVLQLQTKRASRTVAAIRFRVSLNHQMSLFTESLSPEPTSPRGEDAHRLLLRLSSFRITGKRAEQILDGYAPDAIIAGLDAAAAWMEAKEAKHEPIHNPAGVAYKAITEGWRIPNGDPQPDEPHSPEAALPLPHGMTTERLETLRRDFRRQWFHDYIEGLAPSERDAHVAAFELDLKNREDQQMVLSRLHKYGLSGVVLGVFQHYLAERGIAPDDQAFDTFLATQLRTPTV